MINFASLFNQFRGSSNNALNELLEQKEVSLSKLIDEDSFMNQYKSGNAKLVDYMKYDKVKQLIDLITVVGPAEDKKRSFKFPMTAADVLSADIPSLQEFFFPQGKLYLQKITYEDELVEVQIDADEASHELTDKKQESRESQAQKQKTIIKDTLDTPEEQVSQKSKQTQTASKLQPIQVLQTPIQTQTPTKTEQTAPPSTQFQQSSSFKQIKSLEEPSSKPTKPKIKVHRIQKVEKVTKIQVPALIHYLFNYFDQEVTYILTGYVCKVLTALFGKKTLPMMDFLFQNNRIQKMVKHIESRSVGEFLLKVLTHESGKLAKERTSFFKSLLNKLAENNEVAVLSNFSSFVSETIEKASQNAKSPSAIQQFTQIFFSPEVVSIVIRNVMNDSQNVSVYNAPILFTYLTNVPFTLPQDQNIIKQFKFFLEMFIDKSLQKLNVNSKDRPKLGFGRIKIVEILFYILKENLLGSRDVVARKQHVFSILFSLCQNYEMNNVLHNQVVKIVSLAFSDDILSKSLLNNDVLLNFLLTQAEEDEKIRKGVGTQKYRKGFIGHIVQISRLVQEYASKDNEAAIKIYERDEFNKVLTTLVQRQVADGNKSLAGFSLKKDLKSDILFQKQDIITHYIDFLTHSPKPVFEAQPEPINIEHPDFLQQMQRQIQQNLSIEQNSKAAQPINEHQALQSTVLSSQAPQPRIQVHFFKGHLDYDVDQLMKDL